MGIGETVKKGFSVAKENMPLVMVLFIFGAVWNLVNLFVSPNLPQPATAPAPLALGLGIVFLLFSIFMQGGALGYICDKIKTGTANFGVFTASGAKFYLRLFLLGLIIAAVAGILIFGGTLAVAGLGPIGIVLAIFLAAVGIYVVLLVFLAPYAIAADNQALVAAIKTSMAMVRKNILTILGIALLLALIGFVVGLLLGLVLGLLSVALKGGMAAQALIAVSTSFLNAFLGVSVTAAFMTFYLSRRSSEATLNT